MKKLFMLVFVLIFWVNVMEAQKQLKENKRQEFHRGYLAGKTQGEAEDQDLWAGIGYVSAFLLGGCIGGFGSAVASQTIEPSPSLFSIMEESPQYQLGFKEGYADAVKRKKSQLIMWYGVIGVVSFVVTYILFSSMISGE